MRTSGIGMQPPAQQSSLFGAAPRGTIERLFFALWPDEAIRGRLRDTAQALELAHQPRGRWTSPQRYHLTLQFLGDFEQLPPALVEDAGGAAAALQSPAFDLVLDRAGSFRNRSIPWWLGCRAMPDGMRQLWDGLGLQLAKAGVRVASQPKLVPHVTVLRDAGRVLPETPIDPVDWPVQSFALIHSRLGGHSGYEVLGEWALRG